ncbi:MAG TPA: hypothetical protein VNT81_08130 [Vicinamibacterales bacterium]|nr:hypothetical protein [Vicinamibacterales bacterium]
MNPRQGVMSLAIAVVAATALSAFGVIRGTWAVGGSDSSCYALMAQAFANGRLQPSTPLAVDAPWPNVPVTFAPGGFIPSTIHSDAAAPICAPGMSVLMAPLAAMFGQDAIFWLTPIAAFALVMSVFAIASRLSGGMAGASAAILVATSPIVLYQTVQPMNDVLTAALWLAALALAERSAISGVLIGLAILVRPNLAPLAVVMAAMPFIERGIDARAWRSLARMVAGAVPGVLGLMLLNRTLYGSVIGSGYGDASALFSLANINPNLTHYGRALFQTQNIVPAIGLAAPTLFQGVQRRLSVVLLTFAIFAIGIYLLYTPFPEWWYLRFLIPAIAVLLVLSGAVAVNLLSRASMGGLIPIAAVVVGILSTRIAGEREAFKLQEMEGRYRQTAELIRDRLPANAVVITEWQSGSIRFHAGREVVLWESLDPAWFDRSLSWLRSKGLQPYLLLERREEPQFRDRFRAASEVGALDFPPRFDMNRQVRIFDPADRARYMAGEGYQTENIPLRQGYGGRVRPR